MSDDWAAKQRWAAEAEAIRKIVREHRDEYDRLLARELSVRGVQ